MKHIFSFIVLVVMASCATTNYLTIDIKEPAIVSFPNEVKNILIVDNSASLKPGMPFSYPAGHVQLVDDSVEQKTEQKTGILSNDSARAIMLKSLTQFMNEEKYFDKVELYPERTNDSESLEETRPLSASKVRSLLREKEADALISIDAYAVSVGVVNGYSYDDYSFLYAQAGSILRVYGSDGMPLEKSIVYLDSLFAEGMESRWSSIKVEALNNLVSDVSIQAADKLTSAFVPSWKTQDRWYFSDNSSDMKNAATLANQGEWGAAADIWGALYDKEKNTNKKIKLASNLALANENLDDIGNALAWIKIAYSLLPQKNKSELTKLTVGYLSMLTKRENDQAKLYQQLEAEVDATTATAVQE